MKSLVPVVLALALAPAAVHAETWNVTEGAGGKTWGVWIVTQSGASINGAATLTDANGQALKYNVAGAMKDGGYVIQRVAPSDGVACAYVGKQRGQNAIGGTATCNGATAPWSVTRAN